MLRNIENSDNPIQGLVELTSLLNASDHYLILRHTLSSRVLISFFDYTKH